MTTHARIAAGIKPFTSDRYGPAEARETARMVAFNTARALYPKPAQTDQRAAFMAACGVPSNWLDSL